MFFLLFKKLIVSSRSPTAIASVVRVLGYPLQIASDSGVDAWITDSSAALAP